MPPPPLLRIQDKPPAPLAGWMLRVLIGLMSGVLVWAVFGRLDIVDVTIEVIVDTIADFGGRFARGSIAFRSQMVFLADQFTFCFAGPGSFRANLANIEAFIDLAVAIIIQTITNFNGIGMNVCIIIIAISII